jgi:hypothetical protein
MKILFFLFLGEGRAIGLALQAKRGLFKKRKKKRNDLKQKKERQKKHNFTPLGKQIGKAFFTLGK